MIKLIKRFPSLFLILGIALMATGLLMPTDTKPTYITSLVLSGVGGLTTGISLRFINSI